MTDTTIDAAAAQRLEGAVLIDVRTPGEFATARIPGSRNVPLDRLADEKDALLAAEGTIVLVCASGNRAGQAQGVLGGRASVLAGGLTAWQADGGPVESDGRRVWGMERQVRVTAGGLVIVFVALSLAWEPLKWLAAAIGAGLVVAAVTNTCAMARLLAFLPWNRAKA
ncbi:rhodanese-like domain-containing protein [Glycomyces sp. NPDC048151]|uniref:rhodanese-like domain-containing protein n=1 Tax=Glycomyces sp. NPDC048151 TaxID=3364002 RepID=UPI00372325A7